MKHPDSESTVAMLDAMFAAFNRHDAATVVALMTDDCLFETAAGPEVFGARHVGRKAVQATFEQTWETMADVRWDDVRHFACGDRTVSEWTFRATRPDGARIEVQGCDLFITIDGKVAEKRAFRKERPVLPA